MVQQPLCRGLNCVNRGIILATRDIIPTGYYKKQKLQGPAVIINDNYGVPPVIPPGNITDLYWASDAAGANRVTSLDMTNGTYLIVKTQDITANVLTIQLVSDEFSTEDMLEGSINEQIEIPLNVQSNGVGFGFYRIKMDDDVGFKNSKWSVETANRVFGTTYTNDTTAEIAIAVAPTGGTGVYGTIGQISILVDGVTIITSIGTEVKTSSAEGSGDVSNTYPGEGTGYCIVPPGATYRVDAKYTSGGSAAGKPSSRWCELRPK